MEKQKLSKKNIIIISAVVAILVVALGFIVLFKGKDTGVTSSSSSKVVDVAKKIEEEQAFLEGSLQELDSTKETAEEKELSMSMLESTFKLTKDDIVAYKGKLPMINVKASMYLVVEAKDGKVDEVYNKIQEYANNYEKQWQMYLPDQYALVKEREVKKEGNIVYIVVPTEKIYKLSKEISKIGNFTDENTSAIQDMEILNNVFELELEDVETYEGRIPKVNTSASMYILVKPVENEDDDVIEDLTEFGQEYEKQASTYQNEQTNIIKNRKIGKTKDGICYLVMSDKADEIEKLLK